jgi:hypothetical protein
MFLEAGVPYDYAAVDGSIPLDMAYKNPATVKLLEKWRAK